jgi:hypothetical protein
MKKLTYAVLLLIFIVSCAPAVFNSGYKNGQNLDLDGVWFGTQTFIEANASRNGKSFTPGEKPKLLCVEFIFQKGSSEKEVIGSRFGYFSQNGKFSKSALGKFKLSGSPESASMIEEYSESSRFGNSITTTKNTDLRIEGAFQDFVFAGKMYYSVRTQTKADPNGTAYIEGGDIDIIEKTIYEINLKRVQDSEIDSLLSKC